MPLLQGAVEARRLDVAETNEFSEALDDARLCFVLAFAFSRASVGLMVFEVEGEAVATAVLIATVGLAPDGVPPVYGEAVGRPLPGMNMIPLLDLRCWVTGVLG